MYSLRKRIARNLTVNLLLVMAGLLFAFYFAVEQLMHDYIVTRLQHDADSLASIVQLEPDGNWRIDPARMSTVYNRVRSGHYYYVAIGEQTILSRSLFDAEFPGAGEAPEAAGDYIAVGPGDELWLVWQQPVTRDGQRIGIWTAEDIEPIRERLLQQLLLIAVMIAAVVALLVYLQQRALRKAFGVFEWLRLNLATIRQKEGDTSRRLPHEVAPLVAEIEKLVEQLRQRIVRTRNAMGNLAHELKRPLQLLSIRADEARDAGQQATLDEMRGILERELRRARISGSPALGGRFDVAAEIGAMAEVLGKIYPAIDIQVDIADDPASLDLDRDDMLELIGNLFDNACKFANSRARLTLARVGEQLELVFEDDGAGLEPEQIRQLNRRGVRLDESVAGHGLGLGICRDILGFYQGSLDFSRSGLGGLRACARIPLKAAAGESSSS